MNHVFGYARVSAEDQNLATQLEALEAAGCHRIFQEKITGASTERPQLSAMLNLLRAGDTVIVARFFRLGRNSRHLLELLEQFKEQGVEFRALDFGVDSSTPAGKMMMTIFAGFAEYQREDTREKTSHGRRLAREAGKHMGRRPGLNAKKLEQVSLAMKSVSSAGDIAKLTGLPLATAKRYKKFLEEQMAATRLAQK